jgi:hypothetical protein
MAYDQQVSLGANVSAYGVAYVAGPVGSVLAFTPKSPILNREIKVTIASGVSARIDQVYQNTLFAVVSADRSATIFTANTAAQNQTATYNGYNTVTGATRKLVYLGYL